LVVEYLNSIGLTLKEIEKLVTKYPKILNRNVSKDLHPTIMLLENLGISLKDAKRIVVRDPIVFTYKAKKNLGPCGILTTDRSPKKTHWRLLGTKTYFI
jgi:ribosomal protein L7/L12